MGNFRSLISFYRRFICFVVFSFLFFVLIDQDIQKFQSRLIKSAPLDIFCYVSAFCYFFALKLHDFFSSSLALDLRPFLTKSDRGL